MALEPPPPRRFQQSFDPLEWALRNPRRIFPIAWGVVGLILIIWGVLTSFYTVDANQEAVVLRFGKFHVLNGPGFHGKLPFGIDKVMKGEVKTIHREEFGYRTIRAGVQSQFDRTSPQVLAESTMLTGDLNMVVVNWDVRYRISNLEDYIFQVRNPVETLRDISQAVMRTEVGDRSVDEVITLDRQAIENTVAEKMQSRLDAYRCGIHIVEVYLGHADAPGPVRDAFNAVEQAKQTKDRIVNEAEGRRNQRIPAARGAAEKLIKEAEGYKIGRVNRAEGEAEAFIAVLEEYEKAKEVTRRRLYLEAMAEILPEVGEILLIDGGSGDVLKLLDLNRVRGR